MQIKKCDDELVKFYNMLVIRKHFSFQRFADGEHWILQGKKFKLSPNKKNHGYVNSEDWKSFHPVFNFRQRKALFRCLKFKSASNYLGLIVGNSPENRNLTNRLISMSGQDSENLTFANLFVNANFSFFEEKMIPEFGKWNVVLICNEKSVLKEPLLSAVKFRFDVGSNCIVNDYDLVLKLKSFVLKHQIENHLFLFACSTLGNFCITELAKISPNNTYIDCGSTLNAYLSLSIDRAYLSAASGETYRGQAPEKDWLYVEENWPWPNSEEN